MTKNPVSRVGKVLHWSFLFIALLSLMLVTSQSEASKKLASTPAAVAKTEAAPVTHTGFSMADTARFSLVYDSLDLDELGLSQEAYHTAVIGFLNLALSGQLPNADVLSIIDFSRPSNEKRLFVLDLQNGRLLFNSLVAHGKNSGKVLPNRFSNKNNSFMSSLGFYLTGEPFFGQHGYSLRLQGLEKGWNDNVNRRAIIIHSADYVSEDHIRQWGYLGRSEGCPAIPQELDEPIINSIRGGSCLFVYSPNKKYMHASRIIG